MTTPDTIGRRIVFQGLGALGVAVALAGCGGGSDDSSSGGDGAAAAAGTELATTGEVPVGGGVVLADQGVVLTQPTDGEFKAFTAVCTHQGAALDQVGDDGIECPLHGSRFDITDGAPTSGPATEPLAEVPVTVEGDKILVA